MPQQHVAGPSIQQCPAWAEELIPCTAGVQLGSPQTLAISHAAAMAFAPKSDALLLLHAEQVSRVEANQAGSLQVCYLGSCSALQPDWASSADLGMLVVLMKACVSAR